MPGRSGGWTATMLPAGAHWPPGGTVWAYMPATPVQVPLGAAGTTQWAWAPLRNDAAELGTVPPAWTAAAPPNLAESAAAAAREMPHRVGGAWPAAMGKDRLLVMLWSGVLRLASGMAFLGCRAHTHAQLSIRKQGLQQRTRGILVLESHTPSGSKYMASRQLILACTQALRLVIGLQLLAGLINSNAYWCSMTLDRGQGHESHHA